MIRSVSSVTKSSFGGTPATRAGEAPPETGLSAYGPGGHTKPARPAAGGEPPVAGSPAAPARPATAAPPLASPPTDEEPAPLAGVPPVGAAGGPPPALCPPCAEGPGAGAGSGSASLHATVSMDSRDSVRQNQDDRRCTSPRYRWPVSPGWRARPEPHRHCPVAGP